MGPLNRYALIVLAAVICTLAPAGGDEPQCVWSGVERVVAIADVHGDYQQFLAALGLDGIIDPKADWRAGQTHLVQTGDMLDRGNESRKCLDLLMKLEGQAAKAGGAVHALIGNHEAMVLMGDLRYMTRQDLAGFGGGAGIAKLMAAEGVYGKWIRGHNAVIKINDVLFAHAGLTARWADMSLPELNKTVRGQLDKGWDDPGPATDMDGPLWTRRFFEPDQERAAKDLQLVLQVQQARAMIVGHTVSRQGIAEHLGGRLIQADVGMTAYYGGAAACVVMEKANLYAVDAHGRRKLNTPASQPTSRPIARKEPTPASQVLQ